MTESASKREGADRTVLITGASAGIGRAFAEVFAAQGFGLVLVARREERLRSLAGQLSQRIGVSSRVIAADLADTDAPEKVHSRLADDGLAIDALVNNAGYGIPEDYRDSSWSDQSRFLEVMAVAPSQLMHLFLPGMIERGYGRIVNVASLAALLPGMAGHTLYSGVKSFLVKTSQSLTIELEGTGVQVCAICPGFTYTEYHDVIKTRKSVSASPKFIWMTAEDVAIQGYRAVMAGRPVYVNGWVNRVISLAARVLPSRLLMSPATRQIVDR